MSRRAIAVAAAVVVVFFTVTLVTLTHIATGGSPGCGVEVQVPALPGPLRALGGFDQSFDANSPQQIAQVASTAAGAVSPNLDGALPLAPVAERAVRAGQPAALVVPLAVPQVTGSGARIAGLVSFFVGCQGRAYFGSVDDMSALGPAAPTAYPAVSERTAAAALGTSVPQLVYASSPFAPEWRDAQSGATIAAGG